MSTVCRIRNYEIFLANVTHELDTNNTKLTVTWLPENYNMYLEFLNQPRKSFSPHNFTSLSYYVPGEMYFIAVKHFKLKLTWEQASKHCRDMGGYLPYFTNRKQLEELLAFMKLSRHVRPVPLVFIGLRFNMNKVSY